MLISKLQLYRDLGFQEPKDFAQKLKEQKIKRLFLGVKILLQDENNFNGHYFCNDSIRQIGKTTNYIIECLYHFYNGKIIALKTLTHAAAARIHRLIDDYRKILDPLYLNAKIGKYRISSVNDISFWCGYRFDIELLDVI